ncbi:MAG: hypothetical protein EB059_10195 [Alphaproteobacteria bacterium]|nr:hypothetical protein [Alphaproteobacteria bacterium]
MQPTVGAPSVGTNGKMLASPVVGMRALPIAAPGGGGLCPGEDEASCDEDGMNHPTKDVVPEDLPGFKQDPLFTAVKPEPIAWPPLQ